MKRIFSLLASVALTLVLAAPAAAAPPANSEASNGCEGLDTAFSAPAQGVANMPAETSTNLWTRYLEQCGLSS